MSEAQALLDATRLFLAHHEQALAAGDPTRGLAACDGLTEALANTLPAEILRVEPQTPRQTKARDVLTRRVSELEGLSMQLKLAYHQLEEGKADVMRLVALLTATRRQMRALDQTLGLWAREFGAPVRIEPAAMDAMRVAREALVAGCASAAREALRVALTRAGRKMDLGASDDLVEMWSAHDAAQLLLTRPPS